MMRCWEEMDGYEDFVKKEWQSLHVEGWRGFVLKEKLKKIKFHLKWWNKEQCGNIDRQIEQAKEELAKLDLKGDVGVLSSEEVENRRIYASKIHRLSTMQCSYLWQKSRMKWLKEEDANSKFFHSCIQKRRKVNEILGLNFEGVFVDEVEPLREGIKGFFEQHFSSGGWERPSFGNLNMPSLSEAENNLLIAPFSEEEIKGAVWNCENYKSLGPDGVTFSFIKKFWGEVKSDFIDFL